LHLFLKMPAKDKNLLLLVIIFSQFAGTSVWFAGNAVIDQISTAGNAAFITSVVQFGFISGTLVFSFLTIADRFSPSRVFFYSSLIAAAANLFIIWLGKDPLYLPALRLITGFALSGIYPVGMKIAADIFPEKLGKALGYLVGALVFGTSFPHLVRAQSDGLNWRSVLVVTSALSVVGGILILTMIPANKNHRHGMKPDLWAAIHVFRSKPFRSAAFGYFGHMWELYAFWSILPLVFAYYNQLHSQQVNIYIWSFLIIASGSLGCVIGGLLSQRIGSKRVAFYSLLISGICCVVAPFLFTQNLLFYVLCLIWGLSVTADSPQFSALVANGVEARTKGTALTIVTSLGFAITIISIQLLKGFFENYKEQGLWLLAFGPFFGLIALKKPS
jgi:MFS family permease